MNELPAIEVVYDALNALYHNPDPISKERASQWLGDLQKSVRSFLKFAYKKYIIMNFCRYLLGR